MVYKNFFKIRNTILSVVAIVLWVAFITYMIIERDKPERTPASAKDDIQQEKKRPKPHSLYRN
ncbi:hypothetical protein M902_3039 [Bacteriovorax sp. BAL6_X]|uniref:hypothetical protein n=1 Tax=Bacteriovorax sp. BAL6_X TaxID=1201290 RepID=UPI00038681F8|nr:hypothetical protein [Bacteriovorax sp. BAL6_X]EPZ51041.1 hypothetical protein M902_3039 [Bacteriovorax sp. BAL6_X]